MTGALIFDMDGLLVDSEPIWREAEIRIFGQLGYTFTEEMCKQTMGWRSNEVVEYWYRQYQWTGPSVEEVETRLHDEVIRLIKEKGEALPGVDHAVALGRQFSLKLAVASSSPMRIIDCVLDKLAIRSEFELIYSAESEEFGKPHPQVFITTAQQLSVNPLDCVVLEDSFYGVVAGKAARMQVVAIPAAESQNDLRFEAADHRLTSLEELSKEHLGVG